jgi:hypothetical protein
MMRYGISRFDLLASTGLSPPLKIQVINDDPGYPVPVTRHAIEFYETRKAGELTPGLNVVTKAQMDEIVAREQQRGSSGTHQSIPTEDV